MSGRELVVRGAGGGAGTSSTAGALIIAPVGDPNARPLEERLQAAAELEAKLKFINETVPTRVYNVSSSSAGAGSGDFHQYRMVRKQEQERIRRMDAEYKKQTQQAEFERNLSELQKAQEEKTNKKRAKRLKKKAKKKAKTAGAAGADGKAADGGSGSGSGSDSEEEQPGLD